MSHPPGGELPSQPTLGQTLFFSEGSKVAILVKNTTGRRSERKLALATAQAALAWCQQQRAMMVYLPAPLAGN